MNSDDLITSMFIGFDNKPCNVNTNWQFRSSAEADINWKDIKNSLSYAEPLALITRKYRDFQEEDKYVVIDKQLWNKAHIVGLLEYAPSIVEKITKRVVCIDNNFSEWVDWAKTVKAAAWTDGIKSTFNVVLPTV